MQLFEQRMQQMFVTAMGIVFATRFVYYTVKAPSMIQQNHPGFAPVDQKVKTSDRILWAWGKANTGK